MIKNVSRRRVLLPAHELRIKWSFLKQDEQMEKRSTGLLHLNNSVIQLEDFSIFCNLEYQEGDYGAVV